MATQSLRCEHRHVTDRYHVRFVSPGGWVYEMWPSGRDAREAVRKADALLEYVERVGISDYLDDDGVTARPPAQLTVAIVSDPTESESALRCTRPDGSLARER